MKVSPQGLDLIRHFEGLFLHAYLCPARVWTIGYGHTGLTHKDGTVKQGREVTEQEALKLLAHDMGKFEKRVNDLVTVSLTQNEFDALVSFDFNTGALHKSTLLKKINQGDKRGAELEFAKWNRGGGRVLAGLVRRRKAERFLFGTGQLSFFA